MKKLLILAILLCTPCFAAEGINGETTDTAIKKVPQANVIKGKSIDINYDDGIYHIVLSGEKIKKKIEFYSNASLITNSEIHKKSGARLTVNTGYFDPQNGKTISYIVTGNVTVEDPHFNESIYNNPVLRKNLDKIYNRTEFRILQCDDTNKMKYEIVPHNAPVEFGCSIKTSAQGGPLILPELRLEEEFFVVKKDGEVIRESCSVLHKVARTIIGLKDGNIHILIITDDHPMDLYEVQQYCKKLGLEKAMAFDGGSSTSMNYLDKIEVISTKGDGAGRSLKSFMLVY